MRLTGRLGRPVAVLLILAVALAGTVALRLALERHRADRAAREVAVVVVYGEVLDLARRLGTDPAALFARLRQAGVTGVLAKERVSAQLEGAAVLSRPQVEALGAAGGWPADLAQQARAHPEWRGFIVSPAAGPARELAAILSAKSVAVTPLSLEGGPVVLAAGRTPGELDGVGLGLPVERLRALEEQGLDSYVQLRARTDESPPLQPLLAPLERLRRLRAVFFNDRQVTGYPDRLDELGAWLERSGAALGLIEGFPQQGRVGVARRLGHRAVRLHAIQPGELAAMPFDREVERYRLAAVERSIRVLLIRVYPARDPQESLERTLRVVAAVRERLEASGLRSGAPAVLRVRPAGAGELAALGAGVAAAVALAGHVAGLAPLGVLGGLVVLAVGAAATAAGHPVIGSKLGAFAASLAFPVLGILACVAARPRRPLAAVGAAAAATAVAALGGLVQPAFLSHPEFALALDLPVGVKLTVTVPPVAAAVLVAAARGWLPGRASARAWVDRLRATRVPASWLVLAPLLGAAALLFVTRTGNQPLLAPPEWERALRGALTDLLGVRPRFKEFLIGHPALVVAMALGLRRPADLVPLALGAVGLASLVNTFSHAHTPVAVSALRTWNGFWIGAALGLLLLALARGWGRARPGTGEPRGETAGGVPPAAPPEA